MLKALLFTQRGFWYWEPQAQGDIKGSVLFDEIVSPVPQLSKDLNIRLKNKHAGVAATYILDFRITD
ncbi:hypothetical protein DKW60_16515 [Leucothrix pacifica]|uniref:Uncharacterized protein n=1 Tax=Leucothrix pacifica TaxID=1247513 RepID=A0A317C6V3_9GAMM|nr:hypothetical protein DKW60_16515 [Leucothrix pacifica]